MEFLRRLVGFPTVNPPGDCYRECVEFLESNLEGLGLETEIFKVPNKKIDDILSPGDAYPRYNLLARRDFGKDKTIHFNAHYDVVPVSGSWRFPPFSAAVDHGVLFGRGSADMKGSIAALFHALRACREEKLKPAFNLEVSLVCDEEIGGRFGSGYVAENNLTDANFVVVCEGASGNQVGVGHNGVLWLSIDLKGKAAHASRPHKGRNAFDQMTSIGVRLQEYGRRIQERKFMSPGGKEMHPTLTLGGTFGQCEGGKTNIVPSDAWFTLDRRVLPTERVLEVKQELEEFINEAGLEIEEFEAEITSILAIDSYCLDHHSPLPQSLARTVASVRGCSTEYSHTPGFTDAHYFGSTLGIPTVGYGSGGSNYHGVDEQVRIDDLLTTSRVYAEFIEKGVTDS